VSTITKEQRLAEIRQGIDDLETRARGGTAETQGRLHRRFDALRADVDAASVAADEGAGTVEERFAELESRLDIAARRSEAELTSDADSFADAVEAELRDWDAEIERMQARAAVKAYSTRDEAEASVAELRKVRNRAADRLAESRSSSGEPWEEQKTLVTAALDELEQKAREAAAKFN
jgi:hypothetical protein